MSNLKYRVLYKGKLIKVKIITSFLRGAMTIMTLIKAVTTKLSTPVYIAV